MACREEIERVKSAGGEKVAVRFDFGVDGKSAQKILKAVSKEIAVMIITADLQSGKYGAFAASPKSSNVNCKTWLDQVFKSIGGKGGGKPAAAQKMVEGLDTIQEALKLAME